MIIKSISYAVALVATVSILYIGIYPSLQHVITSQANYETQLFQQTLAKTSHGALTEAQVQAQAAIFKASFLAQFGFNQPLPVKFAFQMYHLFTFQFGNSYFLLAPDGSNLVSKIIIAYLPNTVLLFTTGTLLVVAVGSIVGLLAAKSVGGKLDRAIPFIGVFHASLPTWWVGFLFIAFFAYDLNLFPSGGIISVPPPPGLLGHLGDFLYHLTLPLLAFFVVNIGGFAYVIRSLVVSTMGEDFVLTAKARGISGNRILFSHVLRTVSPSIATQAVLAVAGSFGGGLTTEVVFRWPGLGLLTYEAILANDLPIIIASTFILTIILLVGLYIGELMYGILDPRIKAGS
ncbi:MAG: ABC transporter permease [Nitrososphaerales archaeon]